jgi:ABC-type dipeptide/oligopeptide/nickel transport system permease component
MARYIARRLVHATVAVACITLISYGVLYLNGDPTPMLLNIRGMQPAQVEAFRHQMGFDRPWIVQYASYMAKAAQGDFGTSYYQGVPNAGLIADHMPATLELGAIAFVLSLLGIPLGVLAARSRGGPVDLIILLGTSIGQSMPVFWLGLLLMLTFAVGLKWFPVSGRGGLEHLALPAITLAASPFVQNARLVRSSMVEALGQEFVRTARAKGLAETVVIYRHAFRSAMIPAVTLIGIQTGFLLGGAVITETIFSWPGMGRMVVQAVETRDIPLVQASVIVLALTFVLVNLGVDLIYAYLDPRVRLA